MFIAAILVLTISFLLMGGLSLMMLMMPSMAVADGVADPDRILYGLVGVILFLSPYPIMLAWLIVRKVRKPGRSRSGALSVLAASLLPPVLLLLFILNGGISGFIDYLPLLPVGQVILWVLLNRALSRKNRPLSPGRREDV